LLLLRHGLPRREVAIWPASNDPAASATTPARTRLINTALRPAGAASHAPAASAAADAQEGVAEVTRIDCPGPQEEAGVIALLMRECLETPGKRAALVTPDRTLARRVASELRRWDIAIDDSGGRPLTDTAPGTFLLVTAQLFADAVAPVALLAVLKHPLAACGMPPEALRRRARKLERWLLRGPRPAPGFDGLLLALEELDPGQRDALSPWLTRLAAEAAPLARLTAAPAVPMRDLLEAHVAFAEGLARMPGQSGATRLWAEEAGEAAANFVADLAQAAADFGTVPGPSYPSLLQALMGGIAVRPRFGRHPRLAIWGPLVALVQRSDLLFLLGM
jgi:ATP-dependent helicase/nuclease subunit B